MLFPTETRSRTLLTEEASLLFFTCSVPVNGGFDLESPSPSRLLEKSDEPQRCGEAPAVVDLSILST